MYTYETEGDTFLLMCVHVCSSCLQVSIRQAQYPCTGIYRLRGHQEVETARICR
jgi:hypothetical protein